MAQQLKSDVRTTADLEEIEAACAAFRNSILELRRILGKIVIGQTQLIDDLLIGVFAGGHVLIEGVPGLGKTLLVKALAKSLGLVTSRIQFTPDLLPQDLLGGEVLIGPVGPHSAPDTRDTREPATVFRPGPIFANLVLADEINRAGPKTQSALLEAMEERQVTQGDTTRVIEEPFIVVATHNPIELEGTFPLPEAQLDRFLLKLRVAMPGKDALAEILALDPRESLSRVKTVMDRKTLVEARRLTRKVIVPLSIREKVAALILATHPRSRDRGNADVSPLVARFVRLGISPRGGQALLAAARVRALMNGRYNVAESDVAAVALPALRHRLVLSFVGQAEGAEPDEIIEAALQQVRLGT